MRQEHGGSGDGAVSAAEQVAAEIREEILAGVLPQGEALREVALAEAKGVSRRTIREALLMLDAQRLIDHERNRGARVRTLVAEDVFDLYRVRRTLELEGARNAPLASEAARAELREAYAALDTATVQEESRETVRSDLAFHGAVVGLAGSQRLSAFYRHIGPEMELALAVIRFGEHQSGLSAEALIAEHRTICDALLAREVIEAQRAILAHIDSNERFLLGLLSK